MPTRFTSTLPGFDANGAATTISGYYQFGRLAYQTTGSGTLLASYTYDVMGVPVSVQVGTDPSSVPRYYYVYDARGDVANLTDVSGNVVASYAYDPWGNLTSASERIPNANGWTSPYRCDSRDRVRADAATGLDWLATRANDPTTGRFIARDPLGRAPLYLSGNPYVYAGNHPLSNVDPSGERAAKTNEQVETLARRRALDLSCDVARWRVGAYTGVTGVECA